MFVRLKDWNERDTKTGTSFAIIERATKAFAHIKEARVFASSPRPSAASAAPPGLIWNCRITRALATRH
jgi:multidrug efflux pump subunit AcrB